MSELKVVLEVENFPSWAVMYIEYGDDADLTEDDKATIDRWWSDNDLDGCTAEWLEDTGFYMYPEFGLGCDCIHVRFWRSGK